MRPASNSSSQKALQAILDPRVLLRWIYIGRLSIASAILIAAVLQWYIVDPTATRVATVTFALSVAVTGVSIGYSDVFRRPIDSTFLYLQSVFDLGLVTAVVYVTSGAPTTTEFSALYILVIATASLLLPRGGGLLIAALGIVLYYGETWRFHNRELDTRLLLAQLAVFAAVALGTAYVSAQLRHRSDRSEQLVVGLEQVRLRAEDILRNIRTGIVTIDAHGRLVYANPMAEGLLGLELTTQLGRPILGFLSEHASDLATALDRCVHQRVRTARGESAVITGGREFPIGITTTYMDDAVTGVTTATAIFQDISELKQTEALRLRAGRLEGIAELSASLAHEIKNPLASIRSAVEQLARKPRETDDERTLAALVLRESDRLSRLLSEFLDFARVRAANIRPVDVCEIARGAARLAGAHPDRNDSIRVDCAFPEGEPIVVSGDEDLLHRAFFNLTLNAIQASPPGAVVTIEVAADESTVALSEDPDEQSVSIRVIDRGSGIPLEIRDRLFDPFTTTKPQGSGLGLAVVQRAIEAHRGLVLVDTGAGGTRFTVRLPRAANPITPAA